MMAKHGARRPRDKMRRLDAAAAADDANVRAVLEVFDSSSSKSRPSILL